MKSLSRRIAAVTALASTLALPLGAEASIAQDAGPDVLHATEWHLVSMGGQEIAGDPQLRLSADGTVGGSTGCNLVRAGYLVEGTSIEFGPVGTTRKFCNASWETERAFLAMMHQVRGYEISNGTLILTDAGGATLAEFRPGN